MINIQDFDPSIGFSILWRTMRLEGIKTEARLKRYSWYLTIFGIILSMLLGVLLYFVFS